MTTDALVVNEIIHSGAEPNFAPCMVVEFGKAFSIYFCSSVASYEVSEIVYAFRV